VKTVSFYTSIYSSATFIHNEHAFEKKLLDFVIQKLKKTFELHNLETNSVSEKKFSNYVIRKLITNLKKTYGLRNPKYFLGVFLEI